MSRTEVVVYLDILRNWNRYRIGEGEYFYCNREMFGATLGLGNSTVSIAWRKLKKLGWIEIKEGHNGDEQSRIVKVRHVDLNDGFNQISHFMFRWLESMVRKGEITCDHIFLYHQLVHYYRVNGNKISMKAKVFANAMGFGKPDTVQKYMDGLAELGVVEYDRTYNGFEVSYLKLEEDDVIHDVYHLRWDNEEKEEKHRKMAKRNSYRKKKPVEFLEPPKSVDECLDYLFYLYKVHRGKDIVLEEKYYDISRQLWGKRDLNSLINAIEDYVKSNPSMGNTGKAIEKIQSRSNVIMLKA